jgi:pyruvate/2-oxoacid:ferredoxin oxidoreductase alpha subunit
VIARLLAVDVFAMLPMTLRSDVVEQLTRILQQSEAKPAFEQKS